MKKNHRKDILLVEDDELFAQSLDDYLGQDYNVIHAETAEAGMEILGRAKPDLIMLDITLPGMDGMEMLRRVSNLHPEMPVIMLTAIDSIPKVVECMRLGAFDYLAKPVIPEELHSCLERAIESAEMKRELNQRRSLQLLTNRNYVVIGRSAAFRKIEKEIQTAAKADFPVLIQGPTGSGKEVIARQIHAESARATGPFVAINCSAIPKDLCETEFFGHKRGAYTGADSSEIGKFQLAHHGTLLLDEIGELTPEAQAKLLRVLEEREYYPVGSTELVRVDIRVLASTNKNLADMVKEGRFREDLYFRLNVFTISIPPLRERPEDIPPLLDHFIEQFNQKFGKNFREIAPPARELLMKYAWPGNIRELRNLIERVVLSEDGPVVNKDHLYFIDVLPSARAPVTLPEDGINLEEVEKQLIVRALELAKGNKAAAAKLLSLSAPTLYYRLHKYGLD